MSAMADTGAQMCVASRETARRLGLTEEQMCLPEMSVSIANNTGLRILGTGFLNLKDSSGASTSQMVYFADGVGEFYLGKVACRALGIIGE